MTRMSRSRSLERIACALFAAACSQAPPNEVLPCPTRIDERGSYVGFLGPPGELAPNRCVEFYVDGRQRAFTRTNSQGAFFTAFAIEYRQYETPIEMRIDGVGYTVVAGGPTRGTIDYDDGIIPLQETDEGGRAHVRVRVEGSNRIRGYSVNESDTFVEPFGPEHSWFPTPPQEETMRGVWTERGTVVTEHGNGTGGCWWPLGGGEVIRCSNARWAMDRCGLDDEHRPCERGRGCGLIDVEERHSGIGRHQDRIIPVGELRAPQPPPDAGPMADGGTGDAQLM